MRGGDTPTETINYAVVKTIAAFQNSYGGALVIGVEDRTMVVTGIEEDLVFLGIDRDSYEQRLIGLFRKYLGDKSLAGVRIRFEARDGKTVCVIQTRASRSPVFGSDPRKPDKGPTFWVREGNTTRPLHGEAMANYCSNTSVRLGPRRLTVSLTSRQSRQQRLRRLPPQHRRPRQRACTPKNFLIPPDNAIVIPVGIHSGQLVPKEFLRRG